MQGKPVRTPPDPEHAGRRALDFVCRLLSAAGDETAGLEALTAELAAAFDAPSAGIASLDGGRAVVYAAGDSSTRPRADDPELAERARAAPVALCLPRPGGGSWLVTAAAAPGEAGWLVWVEDPARASWDAPLPAALQLAAQALTRQLVPEGTRPRWAEQVERVARQQRLEAAAAVARRLAHDFGNVLTGILGFSELSLTQNVPPESSLHRYLTEVHRGAQAGATFTHQLRLFSRRHPPSARSCALADVLRPEEERVRPLWGGSSFRASVPDDLPPLAIDADHLRQLLAALLDNAREAAGPQGTVEVLARPARTGPADCLDYFGDPRPGEQVEIVVADDGPGLSPEARRGLFADPFFSTKPRRRGLGLATAYGILYAHRGGLRLLPGPGGRGVRAEAVVPVAGPAAAPPLTNGEAASGERVLVVDDDPRVLQFVAATLERAGYRVQAVTSAGEALDRYAAAGPDPFRLVLSDVLMPEVNGVDLARRLRGKDPDVRVLFMSGHVGADFPRPELEGWQFELLPKPFRVDGLLRAVRVALDRTPARRPARPGEGPLCSPR
jgi:signal transduction histidine kinase/ActR/RegA family two-component response regulator